MIKIKQRGSFKKTERLLKNAENIDYLAMLNKYGQEGVTALALSTPRGTGLTAASWGYNIIKHSGSYCIEWYNDNIIDGVKIAVILQYGHVTGGGGWVEGVDYINPAMKPIFKKIADDGWREVTG